MRSQRCGKS